MILHVRRFRYDHCFTNLFISVKQILIDYRRGVFLSLTNLISISPVGCTDADFMDVLDFTA